MRLVGTVDGKGLALAAAAASIFIIIAPARAQGLHEDFNGSAIDTSVWFVDGPVYVIDGAAYLPPTEPYFPWMITRVNPFPRVGDFFVNVRMRYPDAGTVGTGFTDGSTELLRGFGVWMAPPPTFAPAIFVSIGEKSPVQVTIGPDASYHTYEWDYVAGTYYFYFDGHPMGSSASTFRPSVLRIGGPESASTDGWYSLSVDYVYVSTTQATPTGGATWGRLKSMYR